MSLAITANPLPNPPACPGAQVEENRLGPDQLPSQKKVWVWGTTRPLQDLGGDPQAQRPGLGLNSSCPSVNPRRKVVGVQLVPGPSPVPLNQLPRLGVVF